jgi:hypothetical protein
MPAILATWKAEIRRITVGGQAGQIVQETPISKIPRAKWTVGVAQARKSLLCKHEALSSNSSPPSKKRSLKSSSLNIGTSIYISHKL